MQRPLRLQRLPFRGYAAVMAKKRSPREVLAAWCERHGRKVELARALSVNPSSVHRWCVGDSIPTPSLRAPIERVVGIPRAAWGAA